MRAIIQRVSQASVSVSGEIISRCGPGLLVLLGVESRDTREDVEWLSGKVARMRIFSDGEGKMNWSLAETDGEVLVVSQFTLHASTRKGNRPSFLKAAAPTESEPLYEQFCTAMAVLLKKPPERGRFGADMKVSLINDGPVTIFIDSKLRE